MKKVLLASVLALILSACENPNCGDIIVMSSFPYQANVAVCLHPNAKPQLIEGRFTCVCK